MQCSICQSKMLHCKPRSIGRLLAVASRKTIGDPVGEFSTVASGASAPVWKIFQVRCRLASSGRCEEAVVADLVGLIADRDHPIVFRANILVPLDITFAPVAALHRP